MQLAELIKIADEVYPDGLIGQWHTVKTSNPEPATIVRCNSPYARVGDTLAEFVECELRETFDEKADDRDQLAEAHRVMERAAEELADIRSAFGRAIDRIDRLACEEATKTFPQTN